MKELIKDKWKEYCGSSTCSTNWTNGMKNKNFINKFSSFRKQIDWRDGMDWCCWKINTRSTILFLFIEEYWISFFDWEQQNNINRNRSEQNITILHRKHRTTYQLLLNPRQRYPCGMMGHLLKLHIDTFLNSMGLLPSA